MKLHTFLFFFFCGCIAEVTRGVTTKYNVFRATVLYRLGPRRTQGRATSDLKPTPGVTEYLLRKPKQYHNLVTILDFKGGGRVKLHTGY